MVKDQRAWLLEHMVELGLTKENIWEMELDELDFYCNMEPPWTMGPDF